MKHFIKKNLLIISVLALSVFVAPATTSAAWNGTDVPYTVSANNVPVVNVGSNIALTLPTTSTSLNWTAVDSDGTVNYTMWQFLSGPTTGSTSPVSTNPGIASASGSTTLSGMTVAGSYTFRLNAEDNSSGWGWDEITITVSDPISSASGTLDAGNCTIASGASTCSSTVAWTTANLSLAQTLIVRNTGSPSSFTPSPLASGSQAVTLGYGNTTFELYHNSAYLAGDTGIASCTGGTSWDGDSCEPGGGPVNGICGATHFLCASGTSTNQVTGGSSWTWSCIGSNGGTNDSCIEPFASDPECSDGVDNADPEDTLDDKNDPGCWNNGDYDPFDDNETDGGGGGGPQCSDGIDNVDAEDTLADTLDPGCHSDGNVANAASYDPNDDDESNKRKPIYIEF